MHRRVIIAWLVLIALAPAADPKPADPAREFPAADLEFFEKQVRPIFARRCYECHGPVVEEPKGGLKLASRAAVLGGGDTGPAIVPGQPDKSLLIDAIHYRGDYEMPPKSKMPADEIAVLEKWVAIGAPWPNESAATAAAAKKFDLSQRKAEHWCWQPLADTSPPPVKDTAWGRTAIDRFILAKLEAKGLAAARPADRRTLIRRLSFDLLGLPPTPQEVGAFLADDSPRAVETLVDRLLKSPHFGERWGRHWLDLMRYAESRGHEFDYDAPNAYQYRDYVIRALNADVPYNQFATEHIAGDLLAKPRLHPSEGWNESILGTGFWHLGEAVHSPVDIRKDETDRQDNAIDVLGKAFLGLTISCARCHDHKFDAISTADYYALAGFLQSSDYRQVRFETMEHNRRIAEQLWKLDAQHRPAIAVAVSAAIGLGLHSLPDYLAAAFEVIQQGPAKNAGGEIVLADFESGTYDGWTTTGTAFGRAPQSLATIASYQGKINGVGKFFVNSHQVCDGEDIARGDAHVGTLTSKSFEITHDFITLLVGGGAHQGRTCVNLLVGGKTVHSATGRNNNQMFAHRWDVREHRGATARIQIVDQETGGWGNIGVDQIVLTNAADGNPADDESRPERFAESVTEVAKKRNLNEPQLAGWVKHLIAAKSDAADPLHLWAVVCFDKAPVTRERLAELARPILESKPAGDDPSALAALAGARVIIDYAQVGPYFNWMPDGVAFGPGPVRVGEIELSDDPRRPIASVYSHAAAVRDRRFAGLKPSSGVTPEPTRYGGAIHAGRSIRTPTFTVQTGLVYSLVVGSGFGYAVVDSHRLNSGPLHEALVQKFSGGGSKPRWIAHDLRAYRGHTAHLQCTAGEREPLAILAVVEAERQPADLGGVNDEVREAVRRAFEPGRALRLEYLLRDVLMRANHALADPDAPKTIGPDMAELANWLVRHFDLVAPSDPAVRASIAAVAQPYVDARRRLVSQIRRESQHAIAMWEGTGADEFLLVRGNSNAPGAKVPRRFLEAIAGPNQPSIQHGSGRLELARRMTDPANPLMSRVIVNRVWHHLFGRGIVASCDNFGVLGEKPTHPELLDYLASQFIANGWSLKGLIRRITLTSAYQMASTPDARADEIDPQNLLWHRRHMRRLEGEAIRDSMLAVSGRLDRSMYGPSVPIHLTEFQEGRGRPPSGPIDGHGRRSIYLAVRRNFLAPMLLAFDAPIPQSTVGRRNVSNVPAQALILLNDPLVTQQAEVWAKRALAEPNLTTDQRIARLYETAFARPPSDAELSRARAFLSDQTIGENGRNPNQRAWADLCHALFNVKEFVFVP